MFIRKAESKQLLLGMNKKINMSLHPCGPHVWFYTQGGQHDWCLEYQLSNNRKYKTANRPPTPPMSAALYIYPGDGEFTITLNWQPSHAPYPEIQMITAGVFGVTIGPYSYPLGSPGKKVATVKIEQGKVYVNGKYVGYWSELK